MEVLKLFVLALRNAAVVQYLQPCIALLKPGKKKLFKIIWQVIILFNVKCSSDKLIELDLCM